MFTLATSSRRSFWGCILAMWILQRRQGRDVDRWDDCTMASPRMPCLMTYTSHLDRCRGQTSRGCMGKLKIVAPTPAKNLEICMGPAEGSQAKKHHDGLLSKYLGSGRVSFLVRSSLRIFLAIPYSKAASPSDAMYPSPVPLLDLIDK